MAAFKIAFEPPESRPGGLGAAARPIDFAHLGRQTMGDKGLEEEVLGLFAREARCSVDRLGREPVTGRSSVAHRLKGAARGVGAFAVAEAAEALETHPEDEAAMAALLHAVAEAVDFICGLSR